MSQKRPHSTSPPSSPAPRDIYKSHPLTYRSSTFIAAFSPTCPLATLQSLPQFASATHRIAAWRIPSSQTTVSGGRRIDAGFDDDGERYGGKAVLKVLEEEKEQGVVVVARWFGGVMLGPVRFDHLRNCARESVWEWKERERKRERESQGGDVGVGGDGKRVKLTDGEWEIEKERDRLIKELPERDESIMVLRGLLADKKAEKDKKNETAGETERTETAVEEGKEGGRDETQGTSCSSAPATPTRMTPAYEKMPLEALRKLEKVRDATIGWILKQIEDAEQKDEIKDGEEEEAV